MRRTQTIIIMKKFFLFCAIAILSIACASKSIEEIAREKLDNVVTAIANGETSKALKLSEDFEEWCNSLNSEDQKKVAIIALEYSEAITKASFDNLDVNYNYEDVKHNDNYKNQAIEKKATEYCEKILKAIKEGNLDKADNIEDQMDDWMDTLNDDDYDIADDVWDKYEDKIYELYDEVEDALLSEDDEW